MTVTDRRPRIATFAVGLEEYWGQFDGLRDDIVRYDQQLSERLERLDVEVVSYGLVSNADEARVAGEKLRRAKPDLLLVNLATYATSTQVLPVVQAVGEPTLFVSLQPEPSMDHATVDTGAWLAFCGSCPMPEMAAAITRAGLPFRSVTGHLADTHAWERIGNWVDGARVRANLRGARIGMLGHLYPGMLDLATDLSLVHHQFGAHVEVLEMDDLRVRVEAAEDAAIDRVLAETLADFNVADTVADEDLRWAAQVAVGLDVLVEDFNLDGLAYYYRGLDGGLYERLGAGMILGASRLTARGVPCAGEYDLRTAIAMLVLERLGAGGSFTELQALNFNDAVVEMGHDGPAHLAIASTQPILRGLGTYHGKRGHGVSVEFNVAHGPVTMLGLTQTADARFRFVVGEGRTVDGPLMRIGNTTSRVDVDRDPGVWVDDWCRAAPAHHWALGTGHRADVLRCAADLLDIELMVV